ncbi:MAG: hypothetical protein H3Z50_06390 [archaeon]|nr:hypothetical protein [archaeon]MCP8306116.1 hypothetical protein [archaeon]
MRFNKNVGTAIGAYSFFIGTTYTVFGLLEILIGWGDFVGIGASLIPPIELAGINLVPPDVFGGIMLIIIGAVYLIGVRQQARGDREGLSFLLVGSLLAAVFFGVFTAIMLANGLGYMFQFEDWLDWTWLDDLRPGIWLFPLALPGAYLALTKKEWRE